MAMTVGAKTRTASANSVAAATASEAGLGRHQIAGRVRRSIAAHLEEPRE